MKASIPCVQRALDWNTLIAFMLMMSVAGALFGCYRGLTADRGWPKFGWYTLPDIDDVVAYEVL